jgi:hypothetical protein
MEVRERRYTDHPIPSLLFFWEQVAHEEEIDAVMGSAAHPALSATGWSHG